MKKYVLVFGVVAFATSAMAQQPPAPPSEEVLAGYYIETGQLRSALGQEKLKALGLQKQLDETKAELAKLKEEKK